MLAGDLDAVADLTMAQAVHGLAHGNATAAGAMLNMLGDQEGAVPPIDVIRTPRHGQMVTHRVAVLCAGTAPADALSLAEPALAGWISGSSTPSSTRRARRSPIGTRSRRPAFPPTPCPRWPGAAQLRKPRRWAA